MNADERVLVVLLSTALTVFLILGIIALVKVIQILDKVKKITDKAEDLADKAEAIGDFFQKTAGPATLIKTIGKIARSFKQKTNSKEEK